MLSVAKNVEFCSCFLQRAETEFLSHSAWMVLKGDCAHGHVHDHVHVHVDDHVLVRARGRARGRRR
jgi:hypothetical protein